MDEFSLPQAPIKQSASGTLKPESKRLFSLGTKVKYGPLAFLQRENFFAAGVRMRQWQSGPPDLYNKRTPSHLCCRRLLLPSSPPTDELLLHPARKADWLSQTLRPPK